MIDQRPHAALVIGAPATHGAAVAPTLLAAGQLGYAPVRSPGSGRARYSEVDRLRFADSSRASGLRAEGDRRLSLTETSVDA